MKYAFMREHREQFRLESMCEVLSVSRCGCYAWRKRMPSERHKADAELLGHIREAHATSRGLYGSPRITAELNGQGFRCGRNRVARLMKEEGIRAVVKRRRFRRTTDSRHDYALAANLLIDRYQSQQVWVELSIFEYVMMFYNQTRRHSALGYRSPAQYERLLSET